MALAARRAGQGRLEVAFWLITLGFLYTTLDNIRERPDGVRIGSLFILAIIGVSFASRLTRAFDLRAAQHPPGGQRAGPPRQDEYRQKIEQIVDDNDLPDAKDIIFVEVTVTDPSDFESALDVHGEVLFGVGEVAAVTREVLRRAEPDQRRRPHLHAG